MRFGKTLIAAIYLPWKEKYIDYNQLKKLLREDETPTQGRTHEDGTNWTERDEEEFVHELINVQLEKVNQFHVDTYRSLRDRILECESKLQPVSESVSEGDEGKDGKEIAEVTLKELDQISTEINQLQKYARVNYTGFLKAAKKHDRKRGLKYRVRPILQVRLSQLPFNSEDYSPLLYRLSAMYSFARQILRGGKDRAASSVGPRPQDKYAAHRFWVHSDNLLEVRTYMLRQLPLLLYNPQHSKIVNSSQKDPTTTSIYFDNPKFELYNKKVDKTEAAGSLRVQWSGQLKDRPEILLEKKVVSSSDESREIRFKIKEKYIKPFLKGEYKLDKQIKKLEDRYGAESEQVKTLRSNVEEILDFIEEKRLEPMLRASYTRTAYQVPGDDRIRISLDTNVAFIREDALDSTRPCRDPEEWHRLDIDNNELEYPYSSIKKGEISRFPFALLELKVKDSKATRNNAWLSDLMSSHLIKEAPQFSKFVHGVATLFEDYVNSFPFWLSDLDADIRRDPETAFQEEQQKQTRKAEDEFAVGSFLPGSKLSSSAVMKARIGSPHKFPDDAKLSPTSPSSKSRYHVGERAEEHDSDDDGVQGSSTQVADSNGSNGGLRSLFPGFSNSRYARRHRQGTAWKDAPLPLGVEEPGHWIKDTGPVKVEAKVWLANQRTFVRWQHIAVLLATLSLGLYNAAGIDNNVARGLAVVYTAFAIFAGAWGWGVYMWRSRLIMERSGRDFDNMLGPLIVGIGLAAALCLNFVYKYSAAMAERNGPARDGPGKVWNASLQAVG